ncbi:MAG: helix-turn-helix domain-containing protein [Anaerolineae bacterium]|nr:helix-turn-helix domain-containing protein [Anaerolineae bacterium]
MDAKTCYCPNRACRSYGIQGQDSHIVHRGFDNSIQRLQCAMCKTTFSIRQGTAYLGIRSDEAVFTIATRALAEGNSIRGTGRIVDVDKDLVASWLDRAAFHCMVVTKYFFRNLHLTECQLDELWGFVYKKEANLKPIEKILAEYGDAWVWTCFAPIPKLISAFVVGKRTQENADLLIATLASVTDGTIPFFTSDDLPHYKGALLRAYGVPEKVERRPGQRGPLRKPRLLPPPELKYAVVVKKREKGHVVSVETEIVFGDKTNILALLAASPVSNTINTSYVERQNLTIRQGSRRLTRKTNAFSKERDWLEKQLWLAFAYYHFVLANLGLRQELPKPIPTKGERGSPKKWRQVTPAMAAGLTNHPWTMEELLTFRVPPAFVEKVQAAGSHPWVKAIHVL